MSDSQSSRTTSAVVTAVLGSMLIASLSGCKPAEVKPDPAAAAEAEAMMDQYDKPPTGAKPAPTPPQ